jgi:uncharacterized protein (DUF305 family)
VRRRLGCWLLVAVVAAGCAEPSADQAAASDATDVWFMQHAVPHLRQTTTIVDLVGDRITRPELARLAEAIGHKAHGHLRLLQAWLDRRGLAPHAHSHQGADTQPRSDLERLSRVPRPGFDRAFLTVMAARHRIGAGLAAAELRGGSVPEVRQLARRLLAEHREQSRRMMAWRRAWTAADAAPTARTSAPSVKRLEPAVDAEPKGHLR